MAGQLADFSIDQLAGALALVLGSCGGLLLIVFKSRCTQISFCWGLWSCMRQVPEEDSDDEQQAAGAAAENVQP
jgi:hypothetical protein